MICSNNNLNKIRSISYLLLIMSKISKITIDSCLCSKEVIWILMTSWKSKEFPLIMVRKKLVLLLMMLIIMMIIMKNLYKIRIMNKKLQ